jgi:hypothetical protein
VVLGRHADNKISLISGEICAASNDLRILATQLIGDGLMCVSPGPSSVGVFPEEIELYCTHTIPGIEGTKAVPAKLEQPVLVSQLVEPCNLDVLHLLQGAVRPLSLVQEKACSKTLFLH